MTFPFYRSNDLHEGCVLGMNRTPASGPGPVSVRPSLVALSIISIHAVLLAWSSAVHSPNWDEMAHLPSGLTHWQSGRFDLYRVNPPLVRVVAALPVLFTDVKMGSSGGYSDLVYSRSEFEVGRKFISDNGASSLWYFMLARWAVIPLCLIGPWICYRWACELYGEASGVVAVILYCFCPNMLAWGASITPDAAAASLGVLAGYTFWKWLRDPCWPRALIAGAALGVAELSKTTWMVLFSLWPLLWMLLRVQHSGDTPAQDRRFPRLLQLGVLLILGVYLINLSYVFEGSFKPLSKYQFISRTLSGEDRPPNGSNRFAGSWFSHIPVPFPENYIRGIDVQRYDFEQKKWSYLRGEHRKGGWWYYYLYSLLVKSPVGTLAIVVFGSGLALVRRPFRNGWLDELMVLAPALAVLVLVSSQTGFNRYVRYILPALPFLYIAASRVGIAFARKRRLLAAAVVIALVGLVSESLAVFPHSQAFFNIPAGGPRGGHAHLLDANLDWGQDLLFLKRWYNANPQARPLYLAFFGGYKPEPHVSGIEWEPIPEVADVNAAALPPGWYAVSANHLWGYRHFEHDQPVYTHFQDRQPVVMAGYTIYIYDVTAGDRSHARTLEDQ